jgi:hypothetical protein
MTKRQRINKRITATTTELSKEYRRRIRLLESIMKVNGCQKCKKIRKSLFWVYMQKRKKVRKRKEEKTLTK